MLEPFNAFPASTEFSAAGGTAGDRTYNGRGSAEPIQTRRKKAVKLNAIMRHLFFIVMTGAAAIAMFVTGWSIGTRDAYAPGVSASAYDHVIQVIMEHSRITDRYMDPHTMCCR